MIVRFIAIFIFYYSLIAVLSYNSVNNPAEVAILIYLGILSFLTAKVSLLEKRLDKKVDK